MEMVETAQTGNEYTSFTGEKRVGSVVFGPKCSSKEKMLAVPTEISVPVIEERKTWLGKRQEEVMKPVPVVAVLNPQTLTDIVTGLSPIDQPFPVNPEATETPTGGKNFQEGTVTVRPNEVHNLILKDATLQGSEYLSVSRIDTPVKIDNV
jgi:hypothetical protein